MLCGGRLEEELLNLADGQTLSQIEKGAVLLALATSTVGFATGGEALDDAGADEVGWQVKLSEQTLAALTQGQGGEVAQLKYLCHIYG